MRLIQMAYLDLDPPPDFDYPELAMEIDDVRVIWAARWADPWKSWMKNRKVDKEHYPLRARLTFAHPDVEAACPVEHLPVEDNLPPTPAWLNPPFKQSKPSSVKENDGREVRAFDVYTKATELIIAESALKARPSRNEDGLLQIAHEVLRRTATAIEHFADILSVAGRSKRTIGSPSPPVALVAENDHEWSWLNNSKGIADLGVMHIIFKQQFNFDLSKMPAGTLDDRADGVKLLADVFSQSWPTGRFRELWRFFERAFSAPTGRLIVPLADFLGQVDQRFTRREIQKWVALRGPVVHGDRRDEFALSADVEPLLPRMEYAAYDVLLFKEQWRSASSLRRTFSDGPTSQAEMERNSAESVTELIGFQIQGRSMNLTLHPVLGCGPLRLMQPEWPISVSGMWAKGPSGVAEAADDIWRHILP